MSLSWAPVAKVSHKLNKGLGRHAVISVLTGRGSSSQLAQVVPGRTQVLEGRGQRASGS